MEFNHTPVLLNECIGAMNVKPDGIYVDCTLGGGGHSFEIAKRLKEGKLFAFDKDAEAVECSKKRLSELKSNIVITQDDFKNALRVLDDAGVDKIDGYLIDLGISSYQIDNRKRGFSYMAPESKLDMRFDQRQKLSATEVINEYPEEELLRILRDYGEEKFARQIVSGIITERKKVKIDTCGQLVNIIENSVPAKYRFSGGHTAKQTFLSLRIEVNGELTGLSEFIEKITLRLKTDGIGEVITFHSLEDRLVKQTFKKLTIGCTCPPKLPVCICGNKPTVRLMYNKPVTASEEEKEKNKRSISAKLRIAVRN